MNMGIDKIHRMHVRTANLVMAAVFAFLTANPVAADIAQKPLFVTSTVDPNVVFAIDDSGSMHFETMDDSITKEFGSSINNDYIMLVYPRTDGVFGGSDYDNNNRVPQFDGWVSAYFRSPQNNSLYYDPSITYEPWSKSDGSRYPDAPKNNAPHSPSLPGLGGRDFTQQNSAFTEWVDDNGDDHWHTENFWPAVYYWYDGNGDRRDENNYTRVEIRSGTTSYSGHGRSNRTDCTAGACTYEQEIQNFANWYSYHRNRLFAARAGIGDAFVQQDEQIRVGYGSINATGNYVDGETERTLVRGVRSFEGSDRENFFEWLYEEPVGPNGTPLRRGLQGIGEYFERTDNRGPYSDSPGSSSGDPVPCRSNYAILMSDGYWSGNDPHNISNEDGSDGDTHTSPSGDSYQYEAGAPFSDQYSDTLADVAMNYWKRDLTDLNNQVPNSDRNPAFWQHMVTYTVGLGVVGSIDPETAFDAIESGANINWPDPEGSDAGKIDDMLHAAVNGRGGFFAAQNPKQFADELSSVLQDIVEREVGSSASIATNSTRLDTDTLIFQARFDSEDWSGELLAFELDDEDGTVSDTPAWTAEDGIDGLRNIVTFVPQGSLTNGIDPNDPTEGSTRHFEWNDLNNWQKNALRENPETGTQDPVAVGQQRLNWLWGNQSDEIQNGGNLRNREKLLADIVNSNPLYVGGQDFGYWTLIENSGDKWDDYRDFVNDLRDNEPSLLVGANDGKLHAFEAETGEEIFSYVPNMAYPDLSAVTHPDYEHRYIVDGSPRMNDVHDGTEWRRVVVGTMGAGGEGVFAVDITDMGESAGTYTPEVLWEITDDHQDFGNLGHVIGSATIALMQDGKWYAIFGNGYDSSTETASLYLVEVTDPSNVKEIPTNVSGGNGLSTPIPIDFDGDRITDTIYAGDLHGNMWEFDVSDSNQNKWEVANKGGPLFVAREDDAYGGRAQPITGRPEVGLHDDGGVMVFFGTGQYFEPGDGTVGNNPVVQSFYAIRDPDPMSTQKGGGGGPIVERDELVQQEIEHEVSQFGFDLRVVTDNSSTTPDDRKGWVLDLISPDNVQDGERSVARPILRGDRIIFTTLIPSQDRCAGGGDGWLMEMNAMTGQRLDTSPFDLNDDGQFTEEDFVDVSDGTGGTDSRPASGKRSRVGIIQPPGIVSSGDTEYKYSAGSSGQIERTVEQGANNKGRRSWRERQ